MVRLQKQILLGQGATEYLVILAVVLVVGLMVVTLLGGFTSSAGDAQDAQNEMYWQSRTPIAVMGGKADSQLWENTAYIILKNSGKYPVELLAIGPMNYYTMSVDLTDETLSLEGKMEPLSSEWRGGDSYSVYIAPPRGTGLAEYTQKNTLNPGEQIMVGFSVYNVLDPNYNAKQLCRYSSGQTGKVLELKKLTLYYSENVNGVKIVKKQEMNEKPFYLQCT